MKTRSARSADNRGRFGLRLVLRSIFLLIIPLELFAGDCASESAVARIVSVQGEVSLNQQPATLDQTVCPEDIIRVGPFSRAAIIMLATETTVRIDQGSILRLPPPAQQEQSLLDLLQGVLYLFSREPPALDVYTPLVNAAVKGTEFLISAAPERSLITVYEGQVLARNRQGEVLIGSQQSAQAAPNEPPRLIETLRPQDAVQWALYYQPILEALYDSATLSDSLGSLDYRNPAQVLQRIGSIPEPGSELRVLKAGWLLAVGQAAAAQSVLQRLPADHSDVLALSAIIALSRNDKDTASQLARQATEQDSRSVAAWLALSYAQQARFDLDAALDSVGVAAVLAPDSALVQARLSELRLSQGDIEQALQAAQRAVSLNPAIARAQTVLGFAYLSQGSILDARQAFQSAQELDQADPWPRLGLGLAKVRAGELTPGREDLAIAVSLDPQNSILRSYLGKAYFEEKRAPLASTQYEIAKDLDKLDPTPWLYDALLKQAENRSVEALQAIQKSVALNDNRAVYRSRLLLDEDQATRGTRQGLIYRDLGFEQLAVAKAWRSLEQDPANYSAHRLLADAYADLPRHEIARDSELLQSQLLQPLNVNPVQPLLASDLFSIFTDTGLLSIGFNEYSQLFARNQVTIQADGLIGSNAAWADNFIIAGIQDNLSFSIGQFHSETDGTRENNSINQDAFNLFAQLNVTPRTSVQAELRYADIDYDDRQALFFSDNFSNQEHNDEDYQSYRLGFKHEFSQDSILLGSLYYKKSNAHRSGTGFPVDFFFDSDDRFFELRHLYNLKDIKLTGGVGHIESKTRFNLFGDAPAQRTQTNAYAYAISDRLLPATLTLGLSYNKMADDLTIDKEQLNPKLGIVFQPTPATSIRAVAVRTLKRNLIASQTLEPTNIAGFNQFYDDPDGSDAWLYGIGADYAISSALAAGIEFTQRDIKVPRLSGGIDEDKEKTVRLYTYWTPSRHLAVSFEYQYEDYQLPPDTGEEFLEFKMHRLPVQFSYFHPSGFHSKLRSTFVHQEGLFFNAENQLADGKDQFWMVDAALAYRLPRYGVQAALEVHNLFNKNIMFQERGFMDSGTFSREREIFARLSFMF